MNVRAFFRTYWQHACIVALLILLLPLSLLFVPAFGFPKGQMISIPADANGDQIAHQLAAQHVVRSAFQFKVYAKLTGQERSLESGIYVFDHPLGLAYVVSRLANGQHGIQQARVTLTEGMTNAEMAQAIAKAIPGFDAKALLQTASTSQGYLFPDTYFILPGTTPADIVQRLRTNFDSKASALKPTREAVIIASILEKEVQGTKDRRIVAGILYSRLRNDMPLQVDAAPETYKAKGLPQQPIANPGLDALTDAMTPTKTNYVYYLTDKAGNVHYATTFAQHQANIQRYLK